MKIRYITRTISNIACTVMCADADSESFVKKNITLGSDIINWKKYKEGEITDKMVENIILANAITSFSDDGIVPVKVLSWEKVSGLYRISEEVFLANAEKVEIEDVDDSENVD